MGRATGVPENPGKEAIVNTQQDNPALYPVVLTKTEVQRLAARLKEGNPRHSRRDFNLFMAWANRATAQPRPAGLAEEIDRLALFEIERKRLAVSIRNGAIWIKDGGRWMPLE